LDELSSGAWLCRMIRLVTAVGEKINNDPEIGDLLKVYFLPDYNVTLAETLIPGKARLQLIGQTDWLA